MRQNWLKDSHSFWKFQGHFRIFLSRAVILPPYIQSSFSLRESACVVKSEVLWYNPCDRVFCISDKVQRQVDILCWVVQDSNSNVDVIGFCCWDSWQCNPCKLHYFGWSWKRKARVDLWWCTPKKQNFGILRMTSLFSLLLFLAPVFITFWSKSSRRIWVLLSTNMLEEIWADNKSWTAILAKSCGV